MTTSNPSAISPTRKRVPSAQRRSQALLAAREIIRDRGLSSLTMEALASAIDVTKPIIYRQFASAEDVAVAVMREYCERSTAYSLERVQGAPTIHAFFDRLIDSLFEFVAREGPLLRSITNGFAASPRINAFYLAEQQRSVAGYRMLLLDQGVDERRASVGAYVLTEMINQATLEFAALHDARDVEIVKGMSRAALRALVPHDGKRPTIPASLKETQP